LTIHLPQKNVSISPSESKSEQNPHSKAEKFHFTKKQHIPDNLSNHKFIMKHVKLDKEQLLGQKVLMLSRKLKKKYF